MPSAFRHMLAGLAICLGWLAMAFSYDRPGLLIESLGVVGFLLVCSGLGFELRLLVRALRHSDRDA